ncbi:MAG: hypothetical protein A3K54_00165 [Omnitrophica WOR_2 bacterium RBG_13_44_8]|nr:MAG: hypothetical protein A3K54_00165 [Omnitrophica WOR_2 bacterium RBG_13_44_8]
MNELKFTVDLGPVLTQLFAINAKIEALTDQLVKTDEQNGAFKKSFDKHFKRIVNDFDTLYPGIIDSNPFKE